MKHYLRVIATMLIACMCLTGCGMVAELEKLIDSSNEASVEDNSTEASSAVENQTEETENKVDDTIPEDLENLVVNILEGLTEDQTHGYPINESFVLWYYGRYGEDLTRQLLERITAEQGTAFWADLTGNTLHTLWVYYCAQTGMYPEALENVYEKESTGSDIVLEFVGDLNFDEDWPNIQDMNGLGLDITDRMNTELLTEMRQADVLMINNEFTYGVGGTPLEGKAYTFQAHPDKAAWLVSMGVDIVSLANNHVYDYGETGVLSTMEAVINQGLPYVGAGKNLDEASKIVYFVINGKKIAFTSATQIERTLNYTKEATIDSPGVLKTLKPDKYVEVLKEARANADYVVAFVHWGTEGSIYFQSDQKNLAQKYVEAGADVIIGGHTHCLQGFEYREGVPIFYSLGNFWFDWEEENSKATGIAQVVIHEDGSADYRFIPCVYDEYVTYKLTKEEEIAEAYRYMEGISKGVTLDDEGYLEFE